MTHVICTGDPLKTRTGTMWSTDSPSPSPRIHIPWTDDGRLILPHPVCHRVVTTLHDHALRHGERSQPRRGDMHQEEVISGGVMRFDEQYHVPVVRKIPGETRCHVIDLGPGMFGAGLLMEHFCQVGVGTQFTQLSGFPALRSPPSRPRMGLPESQPG